MSNDTKQIRYNDPAGGTASDIGPQARTDWYNREALIDAVKEQYFQPLADVTAMPRHYGKTIKRDHYVPLLDDRNVNDQGIDANGTTTAHGNLWGSSKDIGLIKTRLPVLSETGGRVNRVGYKRVQIEASLEKLGLFDEYTQESLDFDSDSDMERHIRRERVKAANEITEGVLQMDLINGAGVIYYAGKATADGEMTGEGSDPSVVTYDDLVRLSIELDQNRTPKSTTMITGSTRIDTKVVASGRPLFIGSELITVIRKMKDDFDNQAFIPVQHYASAGNVMRGEIGSIDMWRIIVVPEMYHWAGAGVAQTSDAANLGYRVSDKGGTKKYDIYPMLAVGEGSFTTVGFQTDGKSFKFRILNKKPGEAVADRTDPYGETGFASIKWYYATMILRSERLALIKTVARK